MDYSSVKPMKTAIVGCGAISEVFFKNFTERFRIIDLVSCCSKGGASAEDKARRFDVKCSTLEEILADPEIELIVNLTPASQHESIIRAGLEAGKHVYTEKVITPDFRRAKELHELARARGLWLAGEPDHFLGSVWQCARELVDAGAIGQVTSVVASVAENMSGAADHIGFINEPGGGIGFDYGIYLVAQLVALLGPAVEVSGLMETRFPTRTHRDVRHRAFGQDYQYVNEDLVAGTIRFAGGAVATIHLNGDSIMEVPPVFLVYGTLGALSLPSPSMFSGESKLYRAGNFESAPLMPAHGFDHDSRGVGAAEMAWAIRLGREPRASAAFGLHCQEILEGIRESGRSGRSYRLTTACERPEKLPAGYRGIKIFSYDEEGSLVF